MLRQLQRGRVFLGRSLDGALKEAIAKAVATAQPNLAVIRSPGAVRIEGEMESDGWREKEPGSGGRVSYVQVWQAELDYQYDPCEPLPTDLASKFDCLITSDAADCDGSYALHCRRIPVLYLRLDDLNAPAAPVFAAVNGHPMLATSEILSRVQVGKAVERFLSFPVQEGRVFVLEGGDGAGKQTQTANLVKQLRTEGYPVRTLDFPNDAAKYGLLIREVLGGHRGSLRRVSPMVFAAIYGMNREAYQPTLAYWRLKGCNVVLDRYMTANFGHQASKYDCDDQRFKAIQELAHFETKWLDLPPAHRVAYLDLPPMVAMAALLGDATRRALDEHEKAGISYKENVRRAFLWCCDHFQEWSAIPCVDDAEHRLSRDEVRARVWAAFQADFVNQGIAEQLM
jgi:dTMP kinase